MKTVLLAIAMALPFVAGAKEPPLLEDRLLIELSPRDGTDCPGLFVPDALQAQRVLLDIASREHSLPWIAPRAVRCLMQVRGDDVQVHEAMMQWVSDRARPGLMVVVARSLALLAPQQTRELLPLVKAHVAQQPRLENLVMPAVQSMMETERSE